MKNLEESNLQHYIAGFLDGDGCVNAQIIPRADYLLKFQIRFSVTFFQKTSRHWFMIWLKKNLKTGTLRKRNDGISEYAVVGSHHVKKLLLWLLPALQIKKPQAKLVLAIIDTQSPKQSKEQFFLLCKMVDQISSLNDSKKRTNNSAVVEEILLKENSTNPFPVETSEE